MTTLDRTKQYETRDGRPVTIISDNMPGERNFLCLVTSPNGKDTTFRMSSNGKYYHAIDSESLLDMFEVTPPVTKYVIMLVEETGTQDEMTFTETCDNYDIASKRMQAYRGRGLKEVVGLFRVTYNRSPRGRLPIVESVEF